MNPDLLRQVWKQIAGLHAARVAHHDLVASSVLVDEAGRPWVVDFGNALTGADDQALAGDVAELMASLALRIEPAVVVDSALDALGAPVVAAALPDLAPLTPAAATRGGMRAPPRRLRGPRRGVRRPPGPPGPAPPRVRPPGGAP